VPEAPLTPGPPRAEDCWSLAKDALPACAQTSDVPHGTSTASGYFAVSAPYTYLAQQNGSIVVSDLRYGPDLRYGSAVGSLEGATEPVEIAIDETHVYSAGETLVRVPREGGPSTTLFDRPTRAIAIFDGVIYFTAWMPGAKSELWRWSASSGVERVAELDAGPWDKMRLAGGYAFLLNVSTQPGVIERVELETGAAIDLVAGIYVSRGFTQWGGFVYFTEEGTGSVKRAAADGRELVTLASFLGYPQKIDTDGSRLYITLLDADPVSHRTSARLVRLTMDGSEACVMSCATPYSAPYKTYLVVNGEKIYD
jgi:hypothetical protein